MGINKPGLASVLIFSILSIFIHPVCGGPVKGLHLPKTNAISFTRTLTDGEGQRWDIQYYGNIGSGTNNAYGQGLYLQIQGSNFQGNGNQGWANAAGDEVEMGPYSRNNLKIYRRVKIFKDRGLARWLDIFENPTSADITVPIVIYSSTNWSVSRKSFSAGKTNWTEKDWGFVTHSNGGGSNPALMHMVCGKKSKIKPSISISGSSIRVSYSLKVPAGKTVVLCYFESQGNYDKLCERMKKFKPYEVLRDLSPAVRKLIINYPTASGFGSVSLDRQEKLDSIIKSSDSTPVYGKITNESFDLETRFGKITVPSSKIIGMARSKGASDGMFVVLADGQVVHARLGEQKVEIEVQDLGTLRFPMRALTQWSFQISQDRPVEIPFPGASLVLKTGDRVRFDPASTELPFETRHGKFLISSDTVTNVFLDSKESRVHRVMFNNSSIVAGLFTAEYINPIISLTNKPVSISRSDIHMIVFGEDTTSDPSLTQMLLNNSDELYGSLADRQLKLVTEFGTLEIWPSNIKMLSFDPTIPGRVAIILWDGSILRGRLDGDEFNFDIMPGPVVTIAVGQCLSIARGQALSPKGISANLAKLIKGLGSKTYAERQKASLALLRLGKGVVPVLKKQLKTITDPEVRMRIEDVLEKLGPETDGSSDHIDRRGIIFKAAAQARGPVILLRPAIMIQQEIEEDN